MALFVGVSSVNAQHYHQPNYRPQYPVVVVRQPFAVPVPTLVPYQPYNPYGYNLYNPYGYNPYSVNPYLYAPAYNPYYRSYFSFRCGF